MALLLAAVLAAAQGTRADYERADGLSAAFRGKVRNVEVKPRWSADSSRMVYTLGKETWLVDGEKGTRERTEDAKGFAEAPPPGREEGRGASETSPDGRWSVVLKDFNLRLRARDGGEEQALTSDGAAGHAYSARVHWSPDSTKFVSMKTKTAEERVVTLVESSPRDQLQPKVQTYRYPKPGDVLATSKPHLFDVPSKKEIPVPDALFPAPWSIDRVRWDVDGRRFTFLYNQRGHQVLRVIAVDAASGEAKALVDERSATFIDYAHKLFLKFVEPGRLIWMSERSGWNHLYRIDAATGEAKPITQGSWAVGGVDRVDETSVWFRAFGIRPGQDPYHVHHARVNLDGTGLTLLTEGDGTHALQFSPDRRFYVDTWSRVDLAPVVELRRSSDGARILELERADLAPLLAAGWKAPERFVAKGRDGTTDIWGILLRPTTFDPKKSYPVVESIYAGPQGSNVPKSFRASSSAQALAELGFVVVVIDGMGTSHRSKAFHDVCWRNLGDAGFPDRILWMKAAAARYPYLDLARVGVYGGSAGGQNALGALLTQGDFYKAAVADCGCHDNRMDKVWWNELWMGWPVGPHYAEQSNVTLAKRLEGKLLLIVGELDRNVDPSSTMQVVDALIKADKDFDLLVVPGGGHGAGGQPYGVRRTRDFFVRHLLGVEPRRGP